MNRFASIFTIPNLMTFGRLCMLAPMLICLLEERRVCVLLWGALGILSDLLDGWIARRFNQCSDLGQVLDPIADKVTVLVITGAMVLSAHYGFPAWYFILLLLRECLLLVGGCIVLRKGKSVPQADKPGKRSAFSTGIMVLLFIMDWQPWAWIVLYVSLVLTIYSTIFYGRKFIRMNCD